MKKIAFLLLPLFFLFQNCHGSEGITAAPFSEAFTPFSASYPKPSQQDFVPILPSKSWGNLWANASRSPRKIYSENTSREVLWTDSKGNISAQIKIISTEVALDEPITILMHLQYPTSFKFNLQNVKEQLVRYSGTGLAPFTLEKEKIREKIANETAIQEIELNLTVQSSGKHFLTFKDLSFESSEAEKVTLFPKVFEIRVSEQKNVPFQILPLISPLLALSQRLPIEMDLENKLQFHKSPAILAQEQSRNEKLIRSKAIPWEFIIALLTILVSYLIIKRAPFQRLAPSKEKPLSPLERALNELNSIGHEPLSSKNYFDYYTKMDHALRTYFVNFYGQNALTFTSQELDAKIQTSEKLDDSIKAKLALFLKNVEKVKYAHLQPEEKDYLETLQIARYLISNAPSQLV